MTLNITNEEQVVFKSGCFQFPKNKHKRKKEGSERNP